jgi:aminopeptidase N
MSNSGIVNIRGKEYQTVALRVQKFREAHPDWEISTEIIEANEKLVIMQARIYNTECRCIATGHAEEFRAASQINSTSALENAETSAIGRALAAAGWGGTEFASANEVQNAIHQQNKKVDSTNFVEQIRGAKNVEELKTHFANAFAATKQDPMAVAAITAAKDARKRELAA